jgi:hypothetical protein
MQRACISEGSLIRVFRLDGTELQTFRLPHTGSNEIILNGGTLSAGEYVYNPDCRRQKSCFKMTLTDNILSFCN